MIPEISSPTFEVSPLGDLSRLLRRASVLRAKGDLLAAEHLEAAELPAALAAAKTQCSASQVETLVATEQNRLADASLLADLLAPLLAQRLRVLLPLSASPGSAAPPPARAAPAGNSAPPSIADFIDGMLAQDRPA